MSTNLLVTCPKFLVLDWLLRNSIIDIIGLIPKFGMRLLATNTFIVFFGSQICFSSLINGASVCNSMDSKQNNFMTAVEENKSDRNDTTHKVVCYFVSFNVCLIFAVNQTKMEMFNSLFTNRIRGWCMFHILYFFARLALIRLCAPI